MEGEAGPFPVEPKAAARVGLGDVVGEVAGLRQLAQRGRQGRQGEVEVHRAWWGRRRGTDGVDAGPVCIAACLI